MLVIDLTIVFWMAILHRFRGTSYAFPTKNVYWCWIGIPLLLISLGCTWQLAFTWGFGWLIWCIPGWMRVIDEMLHLQNDAYGAGRPLTWDEKLVEWFPGGKSELAIFWRGLIWLIPLVVALEVQGYRSWPLVWVLAWFPTAYIIGHKYAKDGDIAKIAEPIVGACWGIAMAWSLA